jgi:hypothetical protein
MVAADRFLVDSLVRRSDSGNPEEAADPADAPQPYWTIVMTVKSWVDPKAVLETSTVALP